jgi:hypothetical protein
MMTERQITKWLMPEDGIPCARRSIGARTSQHYVVDGGWE